MKSEIYPDIAPRLFRARAASMVSSGLLVSARNSSSVAGSLLAASCPAAPAQAYEGGGGGGGCVPVLAVGPPCPYDGRVGALVRPQLWWPAPLYAYAGTFGTLVLPPFGPDRADAPAGCCVDGAGGW